MRRKFLLFAFAFLLSMFGKISAEDFIVDGMLVTTQRIQEISPFPQLSNITTLNTTLKVLTHMHFNIAPILILSQFQRA